jgi:hypothetical protein
VRKPGFHHQKFTGKVGKDDKCVHADWCCKHGIGGERRAGVYPNGRSRTSVTERSNETLAASPQQQDDPRNLMLEKAPSKPQTRNSTAGQPWVQCAEGLGEYMLMAGCETPYFQCQKGTDSSMAPRGDCGFWPDSGCFKQQFCAGRIPRDCHPQVIEYPLPTALDCRSRWLGRALVELHPYVDALLLFAVIPAVAKPHFSQLIRPCYSMLSCELRQESRNRAKTKAKRGKSSN